MVPAMHPPQEANLTGKTPRAKGWLTSWRPDVAFWAVVSVTGWVVVAMMFTTMVSEEKAKAGAADLSRIAPAAGSDVKPAD